MSLIIEPLLTAVQGAYAAHSWLGVAPLTIRRGPVTDGDLALPAMGLIQDEATEAGGSRARNVYLAPVRVQMAVSIGLSEPQELLATMLAYRDEMRDVARAAVDGRWGLGPVLVGQTAGVNWRVWLTETVAVAEVRFTVPVYDVLAVAPPPPEIIALVSGHIQAGAGKCLLIDATFQVGATGIVAIQYKSWPALVNIGTGRTTNNGNPVNQTVAQAVPAQTQFVMDFTIDATDGVFLDQVTALRIGPFTMPPVGGSGDFELDDYLP